MFSLGWFCGKFGIDRICILSKKESKLPANLANLAYIEFENSISDAEIEIVQKLKALGMI